MDQTQRKFSGPSYSYNNTGVKPFNASLRSSQVSGSVIPLANKSIGGVGAANKPQISSMMAGNSLYQNQYGMSQDSGTLRSLSRLSGQQPNPSISEHPAAQGNGVCETVEDI